MKKRARWDHFIVIVFTVVFGSLILSSGVITSYSIHYTKLYEEMRSGSGQEPANAQ